MNLFSFSVLLLVVSPYLCFVSGHFFPNISSIPRSLLPNITAGAWDSFHNLAGCHAGQTVGGLAKLKSYFHYFGYIGNSSTSNFTNDFDDALESAIRTYQRNFNLNVTGELDQPTVGQIVRPRCGVPDIVNGTTSMNSGRSASISTHTVAHYSFFPGTPRWPANRMDLTYAFSPDNEISDSVKQVFANAFDRWSEVTPITFEETASFRSADIRIAFVAGDHGDGEPFDGVLGTLAHAFSPPSGRLHFDSAENWVIDVGILNQRPSSAVDLESVAVHEIGHVLGLGHSSVEESIMFPTVTSGTRKVVLADDDIRGIQVLYGSNPNYTGPATTFGEGENSNMAVHVARPVWTQAAILAVGLLFFVL